MLKSLFETAKWMAKLARKFSLDLPFVTIAIIGLTLVAQVATLLSFLLPIKIIMIAGLDSAPSFLPNLTGELEKTTVVLILTGLTVVLFATQATARQFSTYASARGVKKLRLTNEKLVIFENQDEIAANSYKQFCESIAGIIFAFLALLGASFLYPDAMIALLSFIAFYTIVLETAWRTDKHSQDSLKKNVPKHFNTFATLTFLAVFCFITSDFLFFEHPQFISGVLSLIIVRQVNARLGLTIGNIYSLRIKSAKIDSLFFRDNIFSQETQIRSENVWSLFQSQDFTHNLSKILHDELSLSFDPASLNWIETGINDTLFLVANTEQRSPHKLLLKLFNKRQSSSAIHEATILLENLLELPAPNLLSTTRLNGYHLHVLDVSDSLPCDAKAFNSIDAKIKVGLTSITVPDELESKYKRSKHLLYDRITNDIFKRLETVGPSDQQDLITLCKEQLNDLRNVLRELPPTLTVDYSPKNLWLTTDGSPLVIHWGSWKLDVAGASWDAKDGCLEQFTQFIEQSAPKEFKAITDCDRKMLLAALVRQAEKEYSRQLYLTCIATWEKIMWQLSELRK